MDPAESDNPIFEAYARFERGRALPVPTGFADRVLLNLAAERTRSRQIRRAVAWALAASVALTVGWFALPREREPEPVPQQQTVELASVKLSDEWSEAGRSLENLTTAAAEPALAPAKRLIDGSVRVQWPEAATSEPALPEIEFMPVAAAVHPITDTPRRAVSTLLRDLGIEPSGK